MELNELKQFDNLQLKETSIEDIIPVSIQMFEEIVKQNNNKIIFINSTLDGDKRKVLLDEEKFLAVLNNVIKDKNYVKISVQNHGEPIEDSVKNKIFKDGFTTRENGFGIGLSVSKKYLAEQLGSIELTCSDEEKTEFLITLPLMDVI